MLTCETAASTARCHSRRSAISAYEHPTSSYPAPRCAIAACTHTSAAAVSEVTGAAAAAASNGWPIVESPLVCTRRANDGAPRPRRGVLGPAPRGARAVAHPQLCLLSVCSRRFFGSLVSQRRALPPESRSKPQRMAWRSTKRVG